LAVEKNGNCPEIELNKGVVMSIHQEVLIRILIFIGTGRI
jgi:hypothetical protein